MEPNSKLSTKGKPSLHAKNEVHWLPEENRFRLSLITTERRISQRKSVIPLGVSLVLTLYWTLIQLFTSSCFRSCLATYRIPLIDMDTSDLSPIHFFVDPGPSFSWPIDEELSDEIVHLYTRFGGSRIEILEAYLNLSKEMCHLDLLHSTGTSSVPPVDDESTSNVDRSRTPSTQIDSTSSIQKSNSASTPVMEKKSSRTSSNFFSKMLRRKLFEPFSFSKRASLKQRQQTNSDASDSSMANESESKRRLSSPLLNTRTNILTIIVTNFQPKRPKTSDNMIKNYIDKCMNEYRLEQSQQKALETSVDENEYRQGNSSSPDYHGSRWRHEPSVYQTSMASHRSHPSTTANRPQPETDLATKIIEQRRIVLLSNSPPTVVNPSGRHVQKKYDMDDNDDSLAMDNGQLSSDVNYLQRKSSQIAQVIRCARCVFYSMSRRENYLEKATNESPNLLESTRIRKPQQSNDVFLSRKLIHTRLLLTEINSWKMFYGDLCSLLAEQQSPIESKPTSLCWILYQRSPAPSHENKSNQWTADLPFKYKGFTKYISACTLETPAIVGLRQIWQYRTSDWSAEQSESKLSENEDQLDSTEAFLQRGFFSYGQYRTSTTFLETSHRWYSVHNK